MCIFACQLEDRDLPWLRAHAAPRRAKFLRNGMVPGPAFQRELAPRAASKMRRPFDALASASRRSAFVLECPPSQRRLVLVHTRRRPAVRKRFQDHRQILRLGGPSAYVAFSRACLYPGLEPRFEGLMGRGVSETLLRPCGGR